MVTNKPLHCGPRPKGSSVASVVSTQKGRIGLGVAWCIECLNLVTCTVEGCKKSTKIAEEVQRIRVDNYLITSSYGSQSDHSESLIRWGGIWGSDGKDQRAYGGKDRRISGYIDLWEVDKDWRRGPKDPNRQLFDHFVVWITKWSFDINNSVR